MNNIRFIKVIHLDKDNKIIDNGFVAELSKYKKANKHQFDFSAIIRSLKTKGEYKTLKNPYGNILFKTVTLLELQKLALEEYNKRESALFTSLIAKYEISEASLYECITMDNKHT